MRPLPLLTILATLALITGLATLRHCPGEATSQAAAPTAPARYTTGPASPDGIGKFHHGREIAQVMGHPGIGWLERGGREREEAPANAINALELAENAVIADIGAGSGYYAFRISAKVPKGRVVAIDIQPEMLEFLKIRAAEMNVTNVTPHLGKVDSVNLPPASLDAALMVDSYHEFSHPAEMLDSLHKALKPGGRIYLLEFRAEDPRVPIKPLHKMTEAQARLELESAGFRFLSNRRHLPWQHLLVFEKPSTRPLRLSAICKRPRSHGASCMIGNARDRYPETINHWKSVNKETHNHPALRLQLVDSELSIKRPETKHKFHENQSLRPCRPRRNLRRRNPLKLHDQRRRYPITHRQRFNDHHHSEQPLHRLHDHSAQNDHDSILILIHSP